MGVVGTARYQQELVGAVRFLGLSFLVAMQGGPFCWTPEFGATLFGGARSELFSHKNSLMCMQDCLLLLQLLFLPFQPFVEVAVLISLQNVFGVLELLFEF